MPDCAPDLADYREVGTLGVFHLKRLWTRAAQQRHQGGEPQTDPNEAALDKLVIYGVGLGLLEALRFANEGASFDEFERWILALNGGALDPARVDRLNATVLHQLGLAPADVTTTRPVPSPVLSAVDLEFWEATGYVVLHDAVSLDQCRAAEAAIWASLGGIPDDPDTWYGGPQGHSIWLPLINHPALDAIRNAPRIHAAFAQLWGTPDLWATVDRAGFNPPERQGWQFPGPHLHWDTSLALPMPFGAQGILYLTDTEAEQGAFTCVPGFHHRLEKWLAKLPAGANPRQQDLDRLGPVPIAGRAADLVIWHHALPHGSSPNRTRKPRIVQYISMFPPWYREPRSWI